MVAADPAVDWSAGDPASIRRGADRNASIAAVMTAEVLANPALHAAAVSIMNGRG